MLKERMKRRLIMPDNILIVDDEVEIADLIALYLENEELANSADVIRILGNDYTHYDRKRPEFDFELLKKYVEVFVTLIEAKLKGCFPPLKRS